MHVRTCFATVHPHGCGERDISTTTGWARIGSSPRMRGTVTAQGSRHPPPRFIPTYAGNGVLLRGVSSITPVHPHVRGELGLGGLGAVFNYGPSPRVRGTVIHLSAVLHEPRFIPTNAGNGPTPFSSPSPTSVHPHVCGERTRPLPSSRGYIGSSPRARGAGGHIGRLMHGCRFIPTCAGSRHQAAPYMPYRQVHPHVRGEQTAHEGVGQSVIGSSPRARGAAQ